MVGFTLTSQELMLTRKGVLALLALALTACTDAPSGPSDTALTPTAPSFAVTGNDWFDVSLDWFNTCGPTQEMVSIKGRFHEVVKQTGDKYEWRFNSNALTGVGQTTGNTYVAKFMEDNVVVLAPGSSSQTLDIRYQLISKGSADSFFLVFHMTFTDPPPTSTFTQTIDCKG
jgi:hypothetical protein